MSSSSKKRSRVSQACSVCSAKKIKCDGKLPECGMCEVNRRECSYSTSKRNTRPRSDHSPRSPVTSGAGQDKTPASSQNQPQWSLDSMPRAEKEDLFRTYFTCIHPIWPVIYKPIYDGISYIEVMGILPQPLMYSMLAIASCIRSESDEDDFGVGIEREQDRTSDEVFPAANTTALFQAALVALQCTDGGGREINMSTALEPSISNCQALTILALQQHGVGEFSRAGVLCTIAAAMAMDLRLHREAWSDDPVQKEVSSRLWWNLFVLDKMLACEMGRPTVLRLEDTDTTYPSTFESDEFELFIRARGRRLERLGNVPAVKLRTISAFHTTIDLSKLMERVSREIFSLAARTRIREDRSYGDKIRIELTCELEAWEAKADASPLKLDLRQRAATPPAMVTNYVVMKSLRILLHRPFIAYWEQTKASTNLVPFDTPDPSEVCFQSSTDICLILDTYSKYLARLPSDLIFIVFVVTENLFRHSSQPSNNNIERAQIQRYIRQCLQWLHIFGKNWRNASARQKLLKEKYNWPTSLDLDTGPIDPNQCLESVGSTVPISTFDFDIASNYSLDEAHFNEIWNEVKDWGFLPNDEHTLFMYDI